MSEFGENLKTAYLEIARAQGSVGRSSEEFRRRSQAATDRSAVGTPKHEIEVKGQYKVWWTTAEEMLAASDHSAISAHKTYDISSIPDTVADAGWEELTMAFEAMEYPASPPREAIKQAYLAMSRLLRAISDEG